MIGVTSNRAAQLADTYDDFPEPLVTLSSGRVWSTPDIEAWIARHPHRPPGRPRRAE